MDARMGIKLTFGGLCNAGIDFSKVQCLILASEHAEHLVKEIGVQLFLNNVLNLNF